MSSAAATVFECDVCGRYEIYEVNSRPGDARPHGWAWVEQFDMSFDLCNSCALPVVALVHEKQRNAA